MAQVKDSFRVPAEVPRYFADKGLKPGFSWLDVWGEEHAYAFTVAKAVDLELLGLFKASIQRAIEKGEGFETWRKQLLPELQKIGWAGKRTVLDPSGRWKPAQVDFTAPRRLQTIFWSNMRAARAAGQWERIQRTKKGLPYLVYVLSTSERKRPLHRSWVGTILPADDPWWTTHFPPNGWHCKCSVRQITKREAEKMGGQTPRPHVEWVVEQNKRTGQIVRTPVGIDPGWGGNPGFQRSTTLTQNLVQRLEQAGAQAAKKRVKEWINSGAAEMIYGLKNAGNPLLPIAVAPEVAKAMGAKTDVIAVFQNSLKVKVDLNEDVDFSTFRELANRFDEGQWVDQGQSDRLTMFIELSGKPYRVIVHKSKTGYLRIDSVHRKDREYVEKALEKQRQEGHNPLAD